MLDRANIVFNMVCDLTATEREEAIVRACAGDADLLDYVRRLIALDTDVAATAASPNGGVGLAYAVGASLALDFDQTDPLAPGTSIGRYTLRECIGRGGFGDVYRADDAEIHREVAVKIIQAHRVSASMRGRFERERQALADMDHPAIAKLFDLGSFDPADGMGPRPYLVMELVNGQWIDKHCDEHRLTIEQRLRLFLDVCAGVQHAHGKAYIHRDLKPSNILVQRDGTPKIIDFGIAKAIGGEHTRPEMTQHGQPIGTPEYMSPEQLSGEARGSNVRFDVYALGVVLHKLLVGELPRRATGESPGSRAAGLSGVDANEPDATPSSTLSRILAASTPEKRQHVLNCRRTTTRDLRRQLRYDLDWIVLKAIAPEADKRYATVDALAQDVERHLKGEVVQAQKPPWRHKTRKFIRRNRAAISIAAVFAVVATSLITWGALGWRSAVTQRERADLRASELDYAYGFQQKLLEGFKPEGQSRRLESLLADKARKHALETGKTTHAAEQAATTVKNLIQPLDLAGVTTELWRLDVLEPAVQHAASEYQAQSRTNPALDQHIAKSLLAIGAYDAAEPVQRRAWTAHVSTHGEHDPATIEASKILALVLSKLHRYAEAEALYRRVIAAADARFGPNDARTLSARSDMAAVLHFSDRLDEAELEYRAAAEGSLKHLGPQHEVTLTAMDNLGNFFRDTNRFAEARHWCAASWVGHRAVLGPDHEDTLMAQSNYAKVLEALGWDWEADTLLRITLDARRRKLGRSHPSTILSTQAVGLYLLVRGRAAEAVSYLDEAYRGSRDHSGLGLLHPDTLTLAGTLSSAYEDLGRAAEAEPLMRHVVQGRMQRLGSHHRHTILAMGHLSNFLGSQGRLSEAEYWASEAARLDAEVDGDQGAQLATIAATLLALQHRYADAAAMLEEALCRCRTHPEWPVVRPRQVLSVLGAVYERWNLAEPSEARAASAERAKAQAAALAEQPS